MRNNCYHGIIFSENDPINRKSCIIFKNVYCLAPATILLSRFQDYQNEVKSCSNHDFYKDLRINRLIDTNTDTRYRTLLNHNFKLIHEKDDTLYESNAFIVNIFKCRNIWNSFNDILRGFVAKSVHNIENDNPNDLHKMLLSSFVILRIKETVDRRMNLVERNNKHSKTNVFSEILSCISIQDNDDLDHTVSSENVLRMNNVKKLECIESVTTPFGNECFLNTINVGKIANIFGDNKCLMVASMPLVNGCEGGAVYNKSNELIGIVISTTFDWNKENATLTLVAKFNEIIAEFVHQSMLTNVNIEDELNSTCVLRENESHMENFIVLIQSSTSWGTGCFIKIGDTRLIITCAHVLENHDAGIKCTWKFGNFSSKIIFKNPHYDQAFDIALLEVPSDVPDKYFTRCHAAPTSIGQLVYSSGFPHFASLGKAKNFLPSIFEGRVTKISKGVIFTDASVQSGQSGGPLFTGDGKLVAICISNSKDDLYQLIYPNINMSVPIFDILPILQTYGRTKGNSIIRY